MGVHEEVMKTYKMVKEAGFNVLDIIFEGAMTVKAKDVLNQLENLAKDRKAMGVVKIIYSVDSNQLRTIEIPVGEPFPETQESTQSGLEGI